jgi:UDP-2,3-diacylglucosamine hydrolase
MSLLFVSDLHLHPSRPRITRLFLEFLAGEARTASHLYILGDLFEAWIGDDDPEPHYREVQEALRELTRAGVRCSFVHGNRDFLVGARFCARTGVELLPDRSIAEVGGQPALLMHGDALCTDDRAYQRLRRVTASPVARRLMLALPLALRRRLAGWARQQSRAAQQDKPAAIMDVNPQAVAQALRGAGVTRLIHGHTHRPAIHRFTLDSQPAERIVLGDWYTQGSVLRIRDAGFELATLALQPGVGSASSNSAASW